MSGNGFYYENMVELAENLLLRLPGRCHAGCTSAIRARRLRGRDGNSPRYPRPRQIHRLQWSIMAARSARFRPNKKPGSQGCAAKGFGPLVQGVLSRAISRSVSSAEGIQSWRQHAINCVRAMRTVIPHYCPPKKWPQLSSSPSRRSATYSSEDFPGRAGAFGARVWHPVDT